MSPVTDEPRVPEPSGPDSDFRWEDLLRSERLPHIWCPECGVGIAVSCFAAALQRTGLDPDLVSVVSGIGCTGRVAGYMRLDSFHTTHGRAIPFATGLKMANRDLKVVVFSGDGDLISIGGNHFIHATTPYGNYEHPFNLPGLAASSGAVYVARWTTLHVRRLIQSFEEALNKKGFSFVEVISPCPTLYTRRNKMGSGLDMMRYFKEKSTIRNGAPPDSAGIRFGGEIVVGKFVDIEKDAFHESIDASMTAALGDEYRHVDATQSVLADRRALRHTRAR
jgi:2-oxoglutarate ferredoxin oxidoreductase subunit beta